MRVVKALLAASILVALPVLLSAQDGDLTHRQPALSDAAVDVVARPPLRALHESLAVPERPDVRVRERNGVLS